MAVRVIRENNRSEGKLPKTGVTIIAGQPLIFDTASTVKPYDDVAGAALVYGIAAESSAPLPIAPPSGMTAGEGFDYTNFARGGLVSCFITGSELELYDDGHGLPYVATDTYALNAPVYANALGMVSAVVLGSPIGSVVDFEGSPVIRLRVKFSC